MNVRRRAATDLVLGLGLGLLDGSENGDAAGDGGSEGVLGDERSVAGSEAGRGLRIGAPAAGARWAGQQDEQDGEGRGGDAGSDPDEPKTPGHGMSD